MMLGREMSPTRKDAFAKGDRADQRSYADIQQEKAMEREHVARVDPDRAKSGGKVTRISMAPPPPPSESEATD